MMQSRRIDPLLRRAQEHEDSVARDLAERQNTLAQHESRLEELRQYAEDYANSQMAATSPAQLKVAQAYVAQLDAAKVFSKPIVTRLEDKVSFFPAETYHQDYMTENPRNPYIVFNDLPKVENLKRLFPERFRSEPVLVKRPR